MRPPTTAAGIRPVRMDGERSHAPSAGGDTRTDTEAEAFNPWTVVNVVFTHLVDQGLHPVLGEHGDPGRAAHDLLVALGIEPRAEGNREVMRKVHDHLSEIRSAVFEQDG